MKITSHFFVLCICTASIVACGPKLSTHGRAVKVAESAPAATCRVIGSVESEGTNEERAKVALQNRAGEMHANTVVVTQHTEGQGRIMLTGQAYGCEHTGGCAAHHPANETCPHCKSEHQDVSSPTPCPHCAANSGQPLTKQGSQAGMPTPVAPQAVPAVPEVPPANTPVTP